MTKRMLNNSFNVTLEEALDDEGVAQTVNFGTADNREAVTRLPREASARASKAADPASGLPTPVLSASDGPWPHLKQTVRPGRGAATGRRCCSDTLASVRRLLATAFLTITASRRC